MSPYVWIIAFLCHQLGTKCPNESMLMGEVLIHTTTGHLRVSKWSRLKKSQGHLAELAFELSPA